MSNWIGRDNCRGYSRLSPRPAPQNEYAHYEAEGISLSIGQYSMFRSSPATSSRFETIWVMPTPHWTPTLVPPGISRQFSRIQFWQLENKSTKAEARRGGAPCIVDTVSRARRLNF